MKKSLLFLLTILMCGLMTATLSAQNCDPITVTDETPWFEDFEGYTGGGEQPFQCWIPLVTDATYNGPFVYCGWANSCHSGANSAEMKGASNLLILPDFTNDITTLRLTFWATATIVTVGTLEVGIITDTTDATTFVSLFTCGAPGPRGNSGSAGNGNLMGPFDFNAATVTGRIALRYTSTSASQSWNLDDFTVSLVPACAEPSGLATSNVTAYSAELTWNEVSGNTYDLLYWPANGDTIVVAGATLNDGVYALDNLTPNTAYGWTVRTDCGDGTYANAFATLSFTTPNIPVALPYEQDFETDPESITDFTLQSTNTNAWIIGNATFNPEDPTDESETGHSLYISNDNSSYAYSSGSYESWYSYAILDAQFPTDAVEWHLAFDYKSEGYAGYSDYSADYLSVYLVDGDATIPTSSMPSGTTLMNMTNGVTDWTHADFILPNVVGSAKKIVFVWKNYSYGNGSNPAAIDNISITSNDCAQPSDLAVTDVTSEEATLTWVENGTATSWTVYWKETGSEDDYTTENANDTAVTLYNLTPNTHYEFYVVAGCESNPTPVFTFLTPNVSVDLPYERTFEEGDDYPVTEFTLQGTGDNQWVVGTATFKPENADDPTETGHSLYISNDNGVTNSYNGTTSYAYAILDVQFDDTPMEYHLAFDYKVTGEGGSYSVWDYLSVFLMDGSVEVPTNANPSGTALLSQAYNVSDWTHADYILPDATGTSKKIVFYWKNDSYTQYNPPAAIDNISIQGFSCAAPSNLTSSNITASSATVQWQENGSASSWKVYYHPVGGSEWTEVFAADTSLIIDDLGGNTTYEFYVTADCSGEESNPSPTATFRTECGDDGITVLPFSEDFEGASANGFVPCWTRSSNDSTGTHQVYHNTTETWAWGSQTLDFGYTPGCYTQAILPMFDNSIPLNTLKVEFDARRTSSEGAFLLGALTDPEDDGTFVVIDTIVTACAGSYYSCDWEHITIYCNQYTGNGQYLAFRADNCGSSSRLIDNLVIDLLPECLPISNLTVSDPTMTGATISWSGDADSYNVYVGGNVYNTTDTFIVISDLNSSSSYSVTVRALCSSDSSEISNAISFNTSCGAITVTEDSPWFEDFEGYAGSGEQPFVCWETPVTTPGGGPFVYCGYGQSAHSGQNTAELKGYTNMLVLPEFSNDIHTLRLSFWATSYGYSTSAVVGVITDIADTATFEVLGDAGTPGPRGSANAGNGNYMGPFDFNGVQATSGRIAILFNGPGTGSGWNLDDFTVELTPTCPSPVKTSVTATNVDGHNATISWTDNDASHTAWTVYYKASTDSEWNTEPASATTIDLANLTPETTYDVYVVTDCGTAVDNPDATLTIHFTTLVACPAPQNLTVSNIGMTSATVSWSGNADNFTIEYGEAGFTPGEGTSGTTTDNTFDMSGLTSGTAYTVYVTADCGADGTSQTASVNFNTNSCEVADQCAYTFILTDDYGDGWNGGSLTVKQNGVTVAVLGLPTGNSATETVNLCDNSSISLEWTAGSFDYEAGFSVIAPDETEVYSTETMSGYTTYTFTSNCTTPTCPRPANITVSNVGATTADVSWTSTGTETAWNVEYKVSTDATWTIIPVTTNPYTLTNLTNLTNYDVRVQADCGGGDVSDYRETSFTTANCEVSDQCTYTFNLTDAYGDGWNGGSLAVQQNGITVAILEATNNNNTPSSETVTVALCDNISTSLVWNSGSYDYEAGFSISGPDGTVLFSHDSMSTYSTYTFTTDCNGSGPIIIEPTVVTNQATAITQTSATLNGAITDAGNQTITAQGFEWKATAGGTYTTVNATGTTMTYNLTGLTAGTSYTYRAFATTANTTTYGDDVTFTTLEEVVEPCEAPTNLEQVVALKDLGSITVTWTDNASVTKWNLQYRPLNGEWITVPVEGLPQYVIEGLEVGTNYEIRVQAVCADDNFSEWSSIITASPTSIDNHLSNSISLYPNPAKEYVDVRIDGDVNVTAMEVYDVYGKLINTVNVVDNPTRVNVSGLANGMYFVRVTTEEGTATKQFVKK